MDTENNALHMNPKYKWCMKKKFGQKFRNWKFFSFDWLSIDRIPIESGRSKIQKLGNFRLIKNHTRSIEILENWIFWKTAEVLCRKHSNQLISWMKCMSMSLNMSMSLKVFQKHLLSTQNFQKQDYDTFVPKFQSKNIFCIKIKEHIILDGQTKFTHNFMY